MTEYIPRLIAPHILQAHNFFPVIVVCGPRQSGKTSLCRHLFPEYKYVNLEDVTHRAAALADPAKYLDALGNHAIIDEVQNVPDLLSMIQVSVDNDGNRRYILTGSSNFALLSTVTQSLAGRVALFTLLPFALTEVKPQLEHKSIDHIICSGLYPGVIARHIPPTLFSRNYYNTYVERDLRDLLKVKNIMAFDTFMRLLASRIGSEFNASSLAREVGVSSVTIAEWLSILATSYIAFTLRPYHANVAKQLTKMPKIYFYDTALACFLLGIDSPEQLAKHNMHGALYENLAVVELLKRRYNAGQDPNIYFYRERSGLEVDVLTTCGTSINLYEIKSTTTYRTSFSQAMHTLAATLPAVTDTTVIYNGPTIAPIAVNIRDL